MRQIRHPLVGRDVVGILLHILETTQGDLTAAERRLDEIDVLLKAIADNPASGVRPDGKLAGWLARHGRRGRMITVVFRADVGARLIYVALIAFGGRNWLDEATDRRSFPGWKTGGPGGLATTTSSSSSSRSTRTAQPLSRRGKHDF